MNRKDKAWLVRWQLQGAPTDTQDGEFFAAMPEYVFAMLTKKRAHGLGLGWQILDDGLSPFLLVVRRVEGVLPQDPTKYETFLWRHGFFFTLFPEEQAAAISDESLKGALVHTLLRMWKTVKKEHTDLQETIREALLVAEARDG